MIDKKELLTDGYLGREADDFIERVFSHLAAGEYEEQRASIKRVFMAGAFTLFGTITRYPDGMTDEEMEQVLYKMETEFIEFGEMIRMKDDKKTDRKLDS